MAIIKVITPSVTDANITTAKVTDNAITLAKMASGTDGNIISYDASGNPVAIATGSDGQVLTSAGAGAQPAFETPASAANTPNFAVYQQSSPGTTLVQNTYTKVVWDSEYYDTNNAFASGRFTVPSGEAGKYFFTSTVSMQASLAEINIDLYLNGSSFWRGAAIHANDNSAQTVTGIIDLSVGNYVEVFVRQNIGTNQVEGGGSHSYFHGYKLI